MPTQHLSSRRPAATSRAAWLVALWMLLAAVPALAGPGHDHGDEGPTSSSVPALPRAVASSELFDLVAVLDGQRITIFIDRSATNEPIVGATLELELAGRQLPVQPVDAATAGPAGGDFTVTLPEALKGGVYPLTATVTAGADIDLLASQFEVHDASVADAHDHAHDHAFGGKFGELVAHRPGALGWAAGALVIAGMFAVWWWRRSAESVRSARSGVKT
jgi:hypothetical protein